MSIIETKYGNIEIKKNKTKFAFVVNYLDNNKNYKHITLCYIKNFPTNDKKIDFSKLKSIFELWFSVLENRFDNSNDILYYDIRKSNSILFGDESEYFLSNTSLWFKSENKYSLDNLIINFNELVNKNLTFNNDTIIEMPHSNQKIYAHSDFKYKVSDITKDLIPEFINLSNVNII